MKALDFAEVKRLLSSSEAVLVDLSDMQSYAAKHIKGSVNVEFHDEYINDRFDLMVPQGLRIVLTCDDDEKTRKAFERLLRAGNYELLGYFPGGVRAWEENGGETGSFRMITPEELNSLLREGVCKVVDCRLEFEWELGYIEGSILIDAGRFWHEAKDLDPGQAYCVVCNTGINSATGASILKNLYGIDNVSNLKGGLFEWKKAGLPIYEA